MLNLYLPANISIKGPIAGNRGWPLNRGLTVIPLGLIFRGEEKHKHVVFH